MAAASDAGARDAVVLAVYEDGTSMGRDVLFARNAEPEAAMRRCSGASGHVVMRVAVNDVRLAPADVLEQHGLAAADVKCIADALATVPARGGMFTQQVFYVRLR